MIPTYPNTKILAGFSKYNAEYSRFSPEILHKAPKSKGITIHKGGYNLVEPSSVLDMIVANKTDISEK